MSKDLVTMTMVCCLFRRCSIISSSAGLPRQTAAHKSRKRPRSHRWSTILKKIIYRFIDYCAMGHVRVPREIPEFVLDFSHTISPKSFSGCNTPASQSIRWDSTSAKTITFTYSISSVTNYAISGSFSSSSPHISYSTTMAYRNRTANSVEVQATTTITMQSGWSGYNYGIALITTYGSVSTRACKLCPSFCSFQFAQVIVHYQ